MTYPPTIDTVTSPADAFNQFITGGKEAGLYVFIRNNETEWQEVLYSQGLSGTRWQCSMPLYSGDNKIEVISAATTDPFGDVSIPIEVTIYLVSITPEVYNVWNCFDEFGLLLGLPRLNGEKNNDYKTRLLDVYTNPANSTYSGLRYGMSRELGLEYSDITINNLSDLADPSGVNNILNSDGNALGTKLEDYADEVYTHHPVFYGNIISDESYWDGVDKESVGYSCLPHIWDPSASGIYNKWQRGGIGDDDDLKIAGIEKIWNADVVPDVSGYSWRLFIHTGYFYSAFASGIFGI